LLFVVVSIVIIRRQTALYTVTMGLGALAWLVGNVLWLTGRPISDAVSWWAAFLVLVIVGERLELSRVMRLTSTSRMQFSLAVAVTGVGLVISLFSFATGVRVASVGFFALALWLFRYDIARRNVRRPALTGFIATNLLVGYVWLAISGVLGFIHAGARAGAAYDAWLHSLFLGFVLSMIFAHALIILPAVSGASVPFHPILYGPVLLMQVGLILRIVGDLALWLPGRQWGGMLNVVAVLWFLLMVVVLAVRDRLRTRGERA
jgi:hypothetical protein